MRTVRSVIITSTLTAAMVAAALASGWTTVALAGGSNWGG